MVEGTICRRRHRRRVEALHEALFINPLKPLQRHLRIPMIAITATQNRTQSLI